jgi:CDP-diglyceride synthetase
MIGVMVTSPLIFLLILWAVLGYVLFELWVMIGVNETKWPLFVAFLGGFLMLFSEGGLAVILGITTLLSFFIVELVVHKDGDLKEAFPRIVNQSYGFLYVFGLGYFLLALRLLPEGSFIVLWTILTIKLGDIGAYLVGKSWGRTKMMPRISPGKTWEGAWGGLALSIFGSLVIYVIYEPNFVVSIEAILGFAIGMNILGQFGDMCESMMKRSVNVKDSGLRIPGIGGAVDLLDSLLMAVPFAYFYWKSFLAL